MKKTLPPQGKCLFCDGLGMTKQHLWPNWMTHILPKAESGAKYGQVISNMKYMPLEGKLAGSEQIINLRPGAVGTRKLRIVCRECNNNWMSKIEDSSKDIIIALMNHEDVILSSDQQIKLVSWIALMAIMVEFTHIPSKVIPVTERKYFLQNKLPPEDWTIWIGKYQGNEWQQRYFHKASQFSDQELTVEARFKNVQNPPEITSPNFQTCVLVVSGLVIFIGSTTRTDIKHEISDLALPNMVQIWPLKNAQIDWKPITTISDKEVNDINNTSETIGMKYATTVQTIPITIV
jgi:hypothetical protein